MPTLEVTYQTEAERLAFQRAIDYTAEMLRLAQGCPDEQVVEACEGLALEKGRQLLRDSLGDAIQARVDAAEKKGASPGPSTAATSGVTKAGTNARS